MSLCVGGVGSHNFLLSILQIEYIKLSLEFHSSVYVQMVYDLLSYITPSCFIFVSLDWGGGIITVSKVITGTGIDRQLLCVLRCVYSVGR